MYFYKKKSYWTRMCSKNEVSTTKWRSVFPECDEKQTLTKNHIKNKAPNALRKMFSGQKQKTTIGEK